MTESSTATAPVDFGNLASRLRLTIARLGRQLRQNTRGGLTMSQWSALVSVEDKERLRIGDLAECEGVSAPTATRLVASLEEAGLLSRTSDPADRRTAYVALTDAGREKLAWAREVHTASLAQRLSGMPEQEIQRLLELLPLLESLLVTE